RETLFANPQHPYTQSLFAATPVTDTAAIRNRIEKRKNARARQASAGLGDTGTA
ncbi:hypothetical protein V6590_14790, partial [Gemmobacter sp. JM10B15]